MPECNPSDNVVSTHSRPKAAGNPDDKPDDKPDVSTHSRPKAAGQNMQSMPVDILFQLTAARRRLASSPSFAAFCAKFQLTAARRRLAIQIPIQIRIQIRFNSQPPEGGWSLCQYAAPSQSGFNSQPPEGGWGAGAVLVCQKPCFNSQPPEGGWELCSL